MALPSDRATHEQSPQAVSAVPVGIPSAVREWTLARYLRRRASKRSATICRRREDGSLWAATSPQNAGYALRGLLSGKSSWHFAKVRIWRGLPIVSRKLFWTFNESGRFDIIAKDAKAFWLPPWAEAVECRKIDAQAIEARRAETHSGSVHESAVRQDAPQTPPVASSPNGLTHSPESADASSGNGEQAQ